jgi:hypothetical protein
VDAQRGGYSEQCGHAGRFLAAFQFPYIDWMQVGLLRQFFLTQFGTLPIAANGFADYFLMSQGFSHAYSGKQVSAEIYTVHSPLFFLLLIFHGTFKTCSANEEMSSEAGGVERV